MLHSPSDQSVEDEDQLGLQTESIQQDNLENPNRHLLRSTIPLQTWRPSISVDIQTHDPVQFSRSIMAITRESRLAQQLSVRDESRRKHTNSGKGRVSILLRNRAYHSHQLSLASFRRTGLSGWIVFRPSALVSSAQRLSDIPPRTDWVPNPRPGNGVLGSRTFQVACK